MGTPYPTVYPRLKGPTDDSTAGTKLCLWPCVCMPRQGGNTVLPQITGVEQALQLPKPQPCRGCGRYACAGSRWLAPAPTSPPLWGAAHGRSRTLLRCWCRSRGPGKHKAPTLATEPRGTPGYVAPEMLEATHSGLVDVTQAVDVYR